MGDFQLTADSSALAWLRERKHPEPWVIAFSVSRCCGGGQICQVRVRPLSPRDDPHHYSTGAAEDGTRFLVDRRAASRLPARFGLTVRGRGRFKHLDLDLEPEQWGELLYS